MVIRIYICQNDVKYNHLVQGLPVQALLAYCNLAFLNSLILRNILAKIGYEDGNLMM